MAGDRRVCLGEEAGTLSLSTTLSRQVDLAQTTASSAALEGGDPW